MEKYSVSSLKHLSKFFETQKRLDNMVGLIGSSHPELGKNIFKMADIPVINCVKDKFANTEIRVEIKDNVRNRDMFIVQTGSFNDNKIVKSTSVLSSEYGRGITRSVNDNLMETLIMIDACRRSAAKSITLIMPCYPYARQDKKDESRAPISAKLVANMLTMAGIDRLIVMDLHASQIQGFFDIPVDNIYSVNLLKSYLEKKVFKDLSTEERQSQFILVSPDAGATKRTLKFSKFLNLNMAIMHKERNYKKKNTVEKTVLICEGDSVVGKTAIICDDMCDTAGTLVKAAETLMEHGAKDVICAITHGIFSGPALERINKSKCIKKIIVSNSLPQEVTRELCSKIEYYDISHLLCDIIKCIGTGESISAMFR